MTLAPQRLALSADAPAIAELMRTSALELFPSFYDERQVASAVLYIARLDEQLLDDGTYFVHEAGGEIVACGGWSRRHRLHAGAGDAADDDRLLDPGLEPARVRAMFVRADWTRRGLGRAILESCSQAARAEGFTRLALMATLPGEQLYRAYGFRELARPMLTLPDGVVVQGVAMEREIVPVGVDTALMASYTSPLAESLATDLLARFDRYVRIDTRAARDRTGCPSTPGQLELAGLLAHELLDIGLSDAAVDQNGYVTATLPASGGGDPETVIGLISHMDTSPDAPGAGVVPIVHRDYDGGVISLPRDGTVLDPSTEPHLGSRAGHDIVTSSGDTLLGADDKAGVAEIMTAVAHLQAHPELPRPTIRICFTPDEEIGEGATLFDVPAFGARCAYTIDGSSLGEIQDETFSAQEATITVTGVEAHPGLATGILVNAARVAAEIVAALPSDRLTPETTSGREGFIHVYEMAGEAGSARIRAILRDFDDELLAGHASLVRAVAKDVAARTPGASVQVEVVDEYPNMRAHLEPFPEVVEHAIGAIRAEGLEPLREPIRGGTDGSKLSAMGLPTPNIFTGGHAYHSVREWASLQDMAAAAAVIVRLAAAWAASPE